MTGDVGTQNSGLRRGTVLQSSLPTAGLEPPRVCMAQL